MLPILAGLNRAACGAHQREHAEHQVDVALQDRGDAQDHQHHLGHLAAEITVRLLKRSAR